MAITERLMTAEELLQTPGLARCELVRGALIMMSPAGEEHGRIAANIAVALGAFAKENRLGRVLVAEPGFSIPVADVFAS